MRAVPGEDGDPGAPAAPHGDAKERMPIAGEAFLRALSDHGVDYLLATQTPAGDWEEPWFTGTGFPGDFMLKYHYYRVYFPLTALGRYRKALEAAGAFAIVLEAIPVSLAKAMTAALSIPTIGIGAGNGTDGQILVWTDFAGLSPMKPRKFVRQYLNLRQQILDAAKQYAADVASGSFPNEAESFED